MDQKLDHRPAPFRLRVFPGSYYEPRFHGPSGPLKTKATFALTKSEFFVAVQREKQAQPNVSAANRAASAMSSSITHKSGSLRRRLSSHAE